MNSKYIISIIVERESKNMTFIRDTITDTGIGYVKSPMQAQDTDRLPTDTEETPHQAFVILGNEIRVEIVRQIGDAQTPDNDAVSFSQLRSRIDRELDPGQLHYHLQKLEGYFLEKTDEGYAMRSQGDHVYKILRTGGFVRKDDPVTTDAEFDCHYCQASVEAIFTAGAAFIECPDCGYRYLGYPIEDIAALTDKVDNGVAKFDHISKYLHHQLLGYAQGICQTCGLDLDAELFNPARFPSSKAEPKKVYVRRWCDYCDSEYYLFLGVALLADKAVLSFCYEHGVDVLSTPFWELEFAGTDKCVTIRSTDPWIAVLEITLDADTLELIVDEDFRVVERNRTHTSLTEGSLMENQAQPDESGFGSNFSGVSSSGYIVNENSDRGRGQTIDELRLMEMYSRNEMKLDETRTQVTLPANSKCLEYLRQSRWPDEVNCPRCLSSETIKKGTTTKDAKRYRCHGCSTTFNDLTGTIFAGHQLSLPEMFYILMVKNDTKISKMARSLNRSYQAVLEFVHEVDRATPEEIVVDI